MFNLFHSYCLLVEISETCGMRTNSDPPLVESSHCKNFLASWEENGNNKIDGRYDPIPPILLATHWRVWLLFAWAILNAAERAKRLMQSGKAFRSNYWDLGWNRIDFVTYSLYMLAILLFVVFPTSMNEIERLLLAVSTVLMWLSLISYLNIHEELGVISLIMRDMMKDLLNFFIFLLIVMLGYGVALISLVIEPEGFVLHNNIFAVLVFPYLQIYGELTYEDLTNTTVDWNNGSRHIYLTEDDSQVNFNRIMSQLLIFIYLLVVGIGFINLLIAMFSDTYRRIKDMQHTVWKYQKYSTSETYSNLTITPPFSLLYYLIKLIYFVKRLCCKKEKDERSEEITDNEERILKWKYNVLKSLMKESSMTFYNGYVGKTELEGKVDLRNIVNDATKGLQEEVDKLRLDNRKKIFSDSKRSSSLRFRSMSVDQPSPKPRRISVAMSKETKTHVKKFASFLHHKKKDAHDE